MVRRQKGLPTNFFPVFFAIGLLVYGQRILRGVWGPLIGFGDTDTFPHLGFLFGKMISLFPWPHLQFFTDWVFYPHGFSAVLMTWSFERETLSMVLTALLGQGPYLPLYAVASVGITGLGTFLLLRHEYGSTKAWLSAFGAAFFGFYAFHRYPDHFNIAICHWMVLNIVADFALYRRWIDQKTIGFRALQVRLLLLFLCLGQDLGYCAGFGLVSFTLTFLFTAVSVWRSARFPFLLRAWKKEARQAPGVSAALALASLFFAWAYVPLCVQLFFQVKSFAIGYSGSYWANPVRWLLPWFPFFNPLSPAVDHLLRDSPEGLGAASPGWTLLLLGGLGAWRVWKKRDKAYLPLTVFVVLCVLHHPQIFPVLKLFPWFSLMRVASRSTVVFPIVLVLFALELDLSRLWRQRLAWVVAIVACLELYTAYFQLSSAPRFSVQSDFWKYQDTIKNTAGEGLLDWPFCIHSGNGATDSLCPFRQAMGTFALQRFHGKKVLGINVGRMTPELVAPFLTSGWRFLFSPNARHTQQTRCFDDAEWKFFDTFYTLGDFAGIQLHADLLPGECVIEFYRRYGTPTAATVLAGTGAAQFLAKDPARREKQDPAKGKALRYEPPFTIAVDLAVQEIPYGMVLEGFHALETPGNLVVGTREAGIDFYLPKACKVEIQAELQSVFVGQSVDLAFDGKESQNYKFENQLLQVNRSEKGVAGLNHWTWKFLKRGDWTDIAQAWSERASPLNSMRKFAKDERNRPARFSRLKITPGRDCLR